MTGDKEIIWETMILIQEKFLPLGKNSSYFPTCDAQELLH